MNQTTRATDGDHGLASAALGAVAIGVLQIGMAISLAALIFQGPLAAGGGRAAAAFILSTAIITIAVGASSKMPTVAAGPQDTPAIIMVAIGASIASADISQSDIVPTALVMVALCALLTALSFVMVGLRGWTSLVRFLPWPVVTGFTAGTGWLLLRGGVELMWRAPLNLADLAEMRDWEQTRFLVPGLVLAAFCVFILESRISNMAVSAAILAMTGGFHFVGRSVAGLDQLESQGWLIGPFPDDLSWAPIGPGDLAATDWGVLFAHTVPIVAVVAVSVIGLLLNLSGLEPQLDVDIDLDHEIRSTGLANVGVALSGGLIGYHLIGDSVLAHRLGTRRRLLSAVVATMTLAVFITGPDTIALMPRSVAGGVLAALGLQLLVGWVRRTLPELCGADRSVSIGILAAIAVLGVLAGVALGVLVAALLFIVTYSRIGPTRFVVAAAGASNVDREWQQRAKLNQISDAVLAVGLQGFLFFGSVTRLSDVVLDRAGLDSTTPTRFVILDFARVSGLDSTAAAALVRVIQRLDDLGIETSISNATGEVASELDRGGLTKPTRHPDLDHAIASCEDQLLENVGIDVESGPPRSPLSTDLRSYTRARRLEPGERLITAGDVDRDLFLVGRGRLTAWVSLEAGRPTRLRQIRAGALLGEVSFCNGGPRTADVIADTAVDLHVLTRETFDTLAVDRPELALEVQQLLLASFADRLSATSAMARHLLR